MPLLVIFSLMAAVHSELGRHISAGESPWFDWVRSHIVPGLALVLSGRILIAASQMLRLRNTTAHGNLWIRLSLGVELFCMAMVIGSVWHGAGAWLPMASTLYLVVVLFQGTGALVRSGFISRFGEAGSGLRFSWPTPWFFGWLFLLGGLTAVIEPSWRRMSDQTVLGTMLEVVLHLVVPAWIGGAFTLWVGIGLAGAIFIVAVLRGRPGGETPVRKTLLFLGTLVFIPGIFGALLLTALMHAVSWQAAALNLKAAGVQLCLIFSVAGSALLALVFVRIVQRWPGFRDADLLGALCLTLGMALFWPLAGPMLSGKFQAMRRWVPVGVVCTACLLAMIFVLFGNLFNPWYTAFSYLKGMLLTLLCVVAAGTGGLAMKPRRVPVARTAPKGKSLAWLLLLACLAGPGPLWTLDAYPEVKAVLLQYNELVRVDTGIARVMIDAVGLGRWFHLGQDPPPNRAADPWPEPWRLRKTHASLLPADFNLLVIVVDALRGDAFSSSGYPRNTTPHLDRWALSEAISFRRAYSQGGGSFAAFPFLVGGRSRFALYGPHLYRRNLYLKLARAENIDQLWVTGRFGPRAVFPPDFPVKILEVDHPVSDRRTPAAGEAFAALDRALDQLSPGERFLCFLHLMDVHNDLWKKEQSVDFGDRPRDIYDNNLSYLDGACARFMGRLKSKGLYDRTVILLTADHGEQFWEHGASLHGHTLYEEEIRVPLILLVHGMVRRFDDVPVLTSDMAPTLADLAGYAVDPPYTDAHMGVSLRSLILNGEKSPYLHRTVTGRAAFKRRYLWYRDWEWKLVYSAHLDVLQLFNVKEDPQERRNLLQEHAFLAAEMESELLDYLKRVEGRTYLPVMSSRAR